MMYLKLADNTIWQVISDDGNLVTVQCMESGREVSYVADIFDHLFAEMEV